MKLSDYIALIVMIKDQVGDVEVANFNADLSPAVGYADPVISLVEQKGYGVSHMVVLSGLIVHPEAFKTFDHNALENYRTEKKQEKVAKNSLYGEIKNKS